MKRLTRLVVALGAAGLVACAEEQAAAPVTAPAPPAGAMVAEATQRTAIVETVNATERSVLLRGDAGSQRGVLATIRVSPAMRNFAQIRPGDRVVYTVTEAVAVVIARPQDGAGAADGAAVALRNAPGERPGLNVTEGNRVRVRVEAVDRRRNTVTYTDANGARRTVRVEDPAMRRFAQTLRAGDMVDVILVESADLRVLPPA
jgi:hypothetical protein